MRSEDPNLRTSTVGKLRIAMIDPSAFTIPYDRHLCRSLRHAGHDVILFTRPARQQDYFKSQNTSAAESDDVSFVTDEGVFGNSLQWSATSRWRQVQLAVKAAEHVRNMRRLTARLKEFRPTAIHFQWLVIPSVDTHFVKRLRRLAPVFLTVHDAEAFHAPSSTLQSIGWASALPHFDGLVVHTKRTRECVEALHVPAVKIKEVPHGLLHHSATTTNSGSDSEPVRDNKCRLLFFGSIKQYKGLDILFQALSLVPPPIRTQMRLRVAGKPDRPERDIRQLAKEYGVDQITDWQLRFFGDDEIDGLFRQSDVVIFPYRRIDASGALMTALPYRKAIIASRLGQFDELLENRVSALLVRPGDPQELARALEDVALQPELRTCLAAGVDAVVRSIPSWEEIGKSTVDFYCQRLVEGCRTTIINN